MNHPSRQYVDALQQRILRAIEETPNKPANPGLAYAAAGYALLELTAANLNIYSGDNRDMVFDGAVSLLRTVQHGTARTERES